MKKKVVSLLMAGALAVSALGLSGCGESGDESSGDTWKMSYWIPKAEDAKFYDEYEDNTVLQYIEANYEFNGKKIDIDFFTAPPGSEQDDFNTLLGTEEYCDIMDLSMSTTSAAELYQKGVLQDLMIAPTMTGGLSINLTGEAISLPYIHLTVSIMEQFGAKAAFEGNVITIGAGQYSAPDNFSVEADWSAASYWYEIQALTCGWTALDGLVENSAQGDCKIAEMFRQLGVESSFESNPVRAHLEATPEPTPRFEADLTDNPDVAQTIAVTCAMLGVPFRLSGLRSLRIKETDRIAALGAELLKVGILLATEQLEGDEIISWDGVRRPLTAIPSFDTYDDHRMAMALAPVAVFIPGIIIRNAEVVSKSYPEFWNHLRAGGFTIEEADGEGTE